jgi:cytochrome d ubiquinol oxidase subunit II
MFENCTYLFLQQYWWIIASLLGALLVFLMFVQGGQTLIGIARNEEEKTMILNAVGRKWEFTFTTLVTFGGAMFAAFPKFYSTSFGGAYWAWMAILFCFTIQAVSYEFRRKKGNFLGPRTYETFLYINGSLGVFLIGAAVGTFFTGSDFSLNDANSVIWNSPFRGVEAIFNIQNVLLGFTVFFLSRILGAMYIMNSIDDEGLFMSARKQVMVNTLFFLPVFLTFVGMLLWRDGFAYDPQTQVVSLVANKYLMNLIEMPIVLVIFLLGVVAVLLGIIIAWFKKSTKGIWFSGLGTVLTVFALLLIAGLNNTSFYPSTSSLQSSLTVLNSSSSQYTLTVMSYVSLLVPFVLAYIFFAWRAIDRKKIDKAEMKDNDHVY